MDSPSEPSRAGIAGIAGAVAVAFAAAAVAIGGASCATLQAPGRSSGGAQSPEGVAIAVARQHCSQTFEPSWTGRDLTEEILEIEVHNAAQAPLAVRRDAFRLVTPDGYALRAMTWRAADPVSVGAGETRTLQLRFMTRGSLACGREMRLDPDGGLRLAGRAISIGAVAFVPRPPPS
jgi:hypothetical protein